MIIAGVVGLVVILGQRVMGAGPAGTVDMRLEQPAGTRIAGVTSMSDRVVVQLQGGGPDRVVVLDGRSLRVLGRLTLAPPPP